MYPNVEQCIVEEEFVKGFNFVFDLIYNPLNTKLLSYATWIITLNVLMGFLCW